MTDLRQSPQYAEFLKKQGWIIDSVNSPLKYKRQKSKQNHSNKIFLYIKKIPLTPFSVMKVQRFSILPDFIHLKRLIKNNKSIFMTLEPGYISDISGSDLEETMKENGFKKGKDPFLPTKTVVVDLTKTKRKLLTEMKKDARLSIKKAENKCKSMIINLNDNKSVENFYFFFRKYGKGYIPKRAEFISLLKAFGESCFLVAVYDRNGLSAGTIILQSERCAYYYYAFTSTSGRKLFSGYLAVWGAMREAKRRRCKIFNFEGIYDERFPQLKRWKGFSTFKKKFGGKEIIYPGPFVSFSLPFL